MISTFRARDVTLSDINILYYQFSPQRSNQAIFLHVPKGSRKKKIFFSGPAT